MSDRPSADRTAELLLWFQREPSRYGAEGRRRNAPPLDPAVILKLALGRRVEFADAALNDPRRGDGLKEAAHAYVRRVFFHPDATPYQTLGLAPGASYASIRESFRLLMQLVHPDRQGARKLWVDSCAAQANQAYAALRDQDTRNKLEREAEARAALARAIYRAATATEASQRPVVTWLNARPRGRRGGRAHPLQFLPEWLTAGLGGFTRRNPAVAAFAILIGGAAIFIGMTASDRQDGMLVRGIQETRAPAETVVAALAPVRETASDANVGVVEPAKLWRENLIAEIPVVAASTNLVSGGVAPPADRSAGTVSEVSPIANAPGVVDPVAEAANAVPSAISATVPVSAALPALAEVDRASASESSAAPSVAMVAAPQPGDAPPPRSTASTGRTELVASRAAPTAAAPPPATAEVEAFFASFVDNYERGRLDAFAALFDDDADTNLRRGRAAIRNEYAELFQLSHWRRMQLTHVNWRRVGDRAIAKGEITVVIGWRDGREVVQRLNVDMELMRRDGRVVIAKLTHQPKIP
jgi:hypothetical protein